MGSSRINSSALEANAATSPTFCRFPAVQGHRVASLVWNAGAVTVYRIRFTGPAALAVRVATELADADGVELISSEQPSVVDEKSVGLSVSVEGAHDDVDRAVSSIRDDLPKGASIEIAH